MDQVNEVWIGLTDVWFVILLKFTGNWWNLIVSTAAVVDYNGIFSVVSEWVVS